MASLKHGQQLRGITSGVGCRVQSLIGEGGQGEVYTVELDGQPYALKWYNDVVLRVDRGLRGRLQVLIDRGAPSPKFLWPFELVTLPGGARLGYLMRLRNAGFQKIHSLLRQEVRPTFRARATLACLLTDALFALHSKGLAYQDLNAGNVFFDPETGDLEICDNDNVDVDGAPSVMGGVWEFQAPEVVLRQAGPTRATDLHSLAVMLFRILHIGHPLIGRRAAEFPNLSDDRAIRRLFGTEARFVFDPVDESNRPLPQEHGPVAGHWALYPKFLTDLFTRAFTEGLYDPSARVVETEWRRATSRLRDSVMSCPACGAKSFYDAQRFAARQVSFACWSCSAQVPSSPPRIGIRRAGARASEPPSHVIVLEPGAQLFAHHSAGTEYDFSHPTAEVTADLALRNLSRREWAVTQGSVATRVGHQGTVPLVSGLRVQFERAEGEIKM